jgi:hypothetical protein
VSKKETVNDNKALTEIDSEQQGKELIENDSRQDKLIRLLCTGMAVKPAAEMAGYSPSYARTMIYRAVKTPAFQEKLKQYVLANYKTMQIPKILGIDDQVLNHLVKNPLDSPKHKDTLKRVQKIAGYLKDDVPAGPTMINIETCKIIRAGLRKHFEQKENEVQDAEFTEA